MQEGILEGAENMAEKIFLDESNRVSDHYVRNIYLNVFLKIAVPWILVTSKIHQQNR